MAHAIENQPPSNEGLDQDKLLQRRLVELDENTVVDLEQTHNLQSLPRLGVHLVDTLQTNDEGQFGLLRDKEVALALGLALQPDLFPLL